MLDFEPPVEILWEDTTSLVVNKPAGILTQGARGIETLETRLRNYLQRRDAHSGTPYVGLPHRIDRPVSGAVLVARNIRAARRFGAQFQSRKIGKLYWAMVLGDVQSDSGTWIDAMRKIPDQSKGELVDPSEPDARQAVLHYRVAQRGLSWGSHRVTRLCIELETGRMHQIRLQCASRGFPVVGDTLYGADRPFDSALSDPRQMPIALHAREIAFRHPKTGVELRVVAPLPRLWGESWKTIAE